MRKCKTPSFAQRQSWNRDFHSRPQRQFWNFFI